METARLSFVLLVIALANLATDITRLVLELTPPTAGASVPVQARPSQQETPVQARDAREPDIPRKDIAQKKSTPLDIPGARGPPRKPQDPGSAREPFSQLRPDFSINHPPWCPACGQPIRRYVVWRRFYEH